MFFRLRKGLGVTLYLVLIVLGVVFALSNGAPVTLTFAPLPYTLSLPLFLLLFGVLIAGVLLGRALGWKRFRREKREANALRRQLQAMEHENMALGAEARLVASRHEEVPPAALPLHRS